jgi:hypothetical protein
MKTAVLDILCYERGGQVATAGPGLKSNRKRPKTKEIGG